MAANIKLEIYGSFDGKWPLDLLVLPVLQYLTPFCAGLTVWYTRARQYVRFGHADQIVLGAAGYGRARGQSAEQGCAH